VFHVEHTVRNATLKGLKAGSGGGIIMQAARGLFIEKPFLFQRPLFTKEETGCGEMLTEQRKEGDRSERRMLPVAESMKNSVDFSFEETPCICMTSIMTLSL